MSIVELFFIGVGLAMDAFAVAVCKGLSMHKFHLKKILLVGIWFGVFQALMPVVGFFLGNAFKDFIDSVDNLIAFLLLVFLGVRMIRENSNSKVPSSNDFCFKIMFVLAFATSIDALTVGITFSFFDVPIFLASGLIGVITFLLSMAGTILGFKFGNTYEKAAQITGGIILIILGVKNLFTFLGC